MTVERDNLLPPTATAFEDAQSQTSARLLDAPHHVIREARQGASAPKQLLPWLAWERSVHHPSDDEATMRARVDGSFADHLSYGSPAALEEEIALDTDFVIRIVEYFEEAGLEWPDFIVEIAAPRAGSNMDAATVLRSALARKNVRDWPASIRLRGPDSNGPPFKVGSASFVSRRMRIVPENYTRPPAFRVGSATAIVRTIRVLPQ